MDVTKYIKIQEELNKLKEERKLTSEEQDIYSRVSSFLDANRLGLKYFVYQGGKIKNTLNFCLERDNKVFSIEEMLEWKNLDDKPTNENWDPILHFGGNKCEEGKETCRHSPDYISLSLAKRYRSDIIG